MIRPYITKVKRIGERTAVTIKSFRQNVDLSMIGVLLTVLILVFVLLSISISQILGGKSSGVGTIVLIIIIISAVAFLFKDQLMLFSFDREERKLIRKLADFIWQNRLYSENHRYEIDYAVIASYRFEGTKLIISLNAVGTGFSKEIQEKEISLQSLVPQLRLIDKRIFSDRTEYVFSKEGDNRIYVN